MRTMNNLTSNIKHWSIFAILLLPMLSSAETRQPEAGTSYLANPLFMTLLFVIILLAIMVMALSKALRNIISSDVYLEKLKRDKANAGGGAAKTATLLIIFTAVSGSLSAATEGVENVSATIGGVDRLTFTVMMIVIALELLTLGILFNTFKNILGSEKKKTAEAAVKVKTKTILDKLNDTVDIEEEGSIMLDHDYDGIKELDNNLPPWWKYGFYLTILIAVIYMINYHVTMTAPLQAEELKISIKKAEAEIAEYMKNSANNVDETTVKLLTDQSDIAAGKDIFMATCAACHGRNGEGTVGPNLTDDYWLHSGSVQDIFKSIKYGWPDKGMKAWKEDYSPMQIAQITSFIKSLRGTSPANAKAKEGEIYIEQTTVSDSTTAVRQDSVKVIAAGL